MRFLKYIPGFCLLFITLIGFTQPRKGQIVTATFRSSNIDEFVKVVEQQTSYKFYYDRAQFDSFSVTITVTALPIDELLKTVFLYTDFHASIDPLDHRIF